MMDTVRTQNRSVLYVIQFFCCFFLLFGMVRADGADQESNNSRNSSSSKTTCQQIQEAAERTENQNSFHLKSKFQLKREDRDPVRTRANGIIGPDRHFSVKTRTPSGMTVRSFGAYGEVVHLDPAKDIFVTSEELGISSVDRKLQDPFEHIHLLFRNGSEELKCQPEEAETIDGVTYQVFSAVPSRTVIGHVVNRMRNIYGTQILLDKTDVRYRFFLPSKSDLIRRISFRIQTAIRQKSKEKNQQKQENGPEWKEQVEEEIENNQQTSNRVTKARIDGTFTLTEFDEDLTVDIPGPAQSKLQSIQRHTSSKEKGE